MLSGGRDRGGVGPLVAVEDLRLAHQFAVGLAADDDDLVADHGGGRGGARVVEARQLHPLAAAQGEDLVRRRRRQVRAPGHPAAEDHELVAVGDRAGVMERQRQLWLGGPGVDRRVVGLDAGRRVRGLLLAREPADDPDPALVDRRRGLLAGDRRVAERAPTAGQRRGVRRGLRRRAARGRTPGSPTGAPEPSSSPPPPTSRITISAASAAAARPAGREQPRARPPARRLATGAGCARRAGGGDREADQPRRGCSATWRSPPRRPPAARRSARRRSGSGPPAPWRACGDDRSERGRAVGAQRGDRRGRLVDVRHDDGHVLFLAKRRAPGEALEQHAAERVDVGASVDRLGPSPALEPCSSPCRRTARSWSAR